MNLSVGIVGLPNAGKSTLFNALLARQIANVASYPFCTIEPNKGIVEVPDERLAKLAAVVRTEKIIPAVIEFIDIAGLVKGASTGQGLGNKFLAHIRECAMIVHVVRAFTDPNVVREGAIDPEDDLKIIQTELELADLDSSSPFLLAKKPALYVLNIGEKDLGKSFDPKYLPICAKIEMELSELEPAERQAFLQELGLKESGLERLIKAAYQLLGLQTFLTAGVKEVRAWTLRRGESALKASGVIHTDFMQAFIKAKVINWQEFIRYGGWKGAGEAGKVRFEGRDYVMQEGDVVEFMVGC
ncbi:MAG: redox-regulated ATPase YchF [Candidatus Shapirobacteria bacterium]